MADYSGRVWHLYPGDPFGQTLGPLADGAANFSPDPPVFIQRIVWRSTDASTPADGDVCTIQDAFDHDVFKRVWDGNASEVHVDLDGTMFKGLKLVALDSGAVDIYID